MKVSEAWLDSQSEKLQGMIADRDSANLALARLCKLIQAKQDEEWFDDISEAVNCVHDALGKMNDEVDELRNQLPADPETGMVG